jgi:PilZ domain
MDMQLTGTGHRRRQRIAVDIQVQVASDGSPTVQGRLRNVSLSGALVSTDHVLPLHAYLEISIETLGAGHRAEIVTARVMRTFEGGVGVEWCEFAPSAVTDLLRSPSF